MARTAKKTAAASGAGTVSRFEASLLVNRWLLDLLGAEAGFESLKPLLRELPEGEAADGQSHFHHALVCKGGLKVDLERLAAYDRRLMDYQKRMARTREAFRFKYFQYLALLCMELLLDRLTADPAACVREMNGWLDRQRPVNADLDRLDTVTLDDLRQFAFYMATGSGKTLVMHVNFRQVLYYLRHGVHPEALVRRADGRRQFANVLLVTPSEGMSAQHLEELRESGIDARLLIESSGEGDGDPAIVDPVVRVVEIHKLVLNESGRASGQGVSIPVESLGSDNLVLVDEGHKGTGKEAGVWKRVQKALAADGMLLEYSATYAQAIAAANAGRGRDELIAEYGKSIVFDYSYRHFHGDGYGKDFRVLNLSGDTAGYEELLMLGSLAAFYQQVRLFHENREACRLYNIEQPLWVLLGTTVGKDEGSDVVKLIAFLKKFMKDEKWAVDNLKKFLKGESRIEDGHHQDVFQEQLAPLNAAGVSGQQVYDGICATICRGKGGITVRELKNAPGELGIRVSSARATDYFAVINIGEVSEFKNVLAGGAGIEVEPDRISPSHFDRAVVEAPDSPVYMVIGAKKFIEGWSCWRVSSMGLLNVGKGVGSQIIQLFGRGVRLKGRGMSLKRSSEYPDEKHPPGIETLETLAIFGWNADYLTKFKEAVDAEDVSRFVGSFPVRYRDPWPALPLYGVRVDTRDRVWVLDSTGKSVILNMLPHFTVQSRTIGANAHITDSNAANFFLHNKREWLDAELLYADLLLHKRERWPEQSLFIPRAVVPELFAKIECWIPGNKQNDPAYLHHLASVGLRKYADAFFRDKIRRCELDPDHVTYTELPRPRGEAYRSSDIRLVEEYRVFSRDASLEQAIRELLAQPAELLKDGVEPLPRLHLDAHLFDPLLVEGDEDWKSRVTVIPTAINAGEQQLLRDIRAFWQDNHDKPEYAATELFLLRNSVKSGISLFHNAGFYPDFVLWIRDKAGIRVVFLEPHGMVRESPEDSDRYKALEAISLLNDNPDFKGRKVGFRGYLLPSGSTKVMGHMDKSEDQLETTFPHLLFMREGYVRQIIDGRV